MHNKCLGWGPKRGSTKSSYRQHGWTGYKTLLNSQLLMYLESFKGKWSTLSPPLNSFRLQSFTQPEEVVLCYKSERAASPCLICSLQSQSSSPAAADCVVTARWKPAREDLGGSHQLTARQLVSEAMKGNGGPRSSLQPSKTSNNRDFS